jgi:pantothenate kinase type III
MKAEMAGQPKVIATGGNARLLAGVARSIDTVNEDLGLEGLRILWTQTRGR